MYKKVKFTMLAIFCCLLFTACGDKEPGAKVESTEAQFTSPIAGDTIATIETSAGTIKLLLFPKAAPKAVENFTTLAEKGYYDHVTFHRVVKGFIIQAGDPTGTGTGGESKWGVPFENEITDTLHHYRGAVGMANAARDKNSSQFYIVQTPKKSIDAEMIQKLRDAGRREEVISAYEAYGGAPYLDYNYTVFAQVYEGMNVVDEIGRSATKKDSEQPKKDITITSVTITIFEAPSE